MNGLKCKLFCSFLHSPHVLPAEDLGGTLLVLLIETRRQCQCQVWYPQEDPKFWNSILCSESESVSHSVLFIRHLLTEHLFCVKGLGREQTDRQKWSLSSWSFHLGLGIGMGVGSGKIGWSGVLPSVVMCFEANKSGWWESDVSGQSRWLWIESAACPVGAISVSPSQGWWEWGSHTRGASRSRGL